MLNSYGGRKAALKPQQSKQYPSSSASKSGSFRLPSFLSTLPSLTIFGTNDESINKQQFHPKDQQVDLGGYRGGGSSAAVDRDYYNYDRNNQEKNTSFALSEAQRRNLKGIYKTNSNNVTGSNNYNTSAVDGRKHSQNHLTGNNTRSNQPPSTATLQKSNNPSNNNNYKSIYPPGGAPPSNNLFPVKENSKSHLEPNKPNLPIQSQAETQAYIRGRYSTSTTTSKSSDQTTSSTASSSSVNNTPSSSMFPSSLFPSVTTSKERDREAKTSSSAPPAAASGVKVICDKCDGKHSTDSCPYYKKPREDHPDAQKGKQMGGTSLLPGSFLSSARVVRQPGDGSCLFHSMSYGYGQGYNATRLRSEICAFIAQNPDLKISDTPMKDWIRWDSNSTVLDYSRRMSRGGWGGGIEMAAFSQMKQVNVHVYERHGMGYKRISAFDYHISPETKPVIRVLYGGGVHYGKLIRFSLFLLY